MGPAPGSVLLVLPGRAFAVMNVVDSAITGAVALAIGAWGEDLRFLGVTVKGTVDRLQDQSQLLGDIGNELTQQSSILVKRGALPRDAKKGDVFVDQFGYEHRVNADPVSFPTHWMLRCTMTRFNVRSRSNFLGTVSG